MWTQHADGTLEATGFVPRDAEFRITQSGKELCKFSVKVSEKIVEGQREAAWMNVIAWQQMAVIASEIRKGDIVNVRGKVETNTFTGNDGEEKTTKQLVCGWIQRMKRPEEVNALIAASPDTGNPYSGQNDDDIPDDLPF